MAWNVQNCKKKSGLWNPLIILKLIKSSKITKNTCLYFVQSAIEQKQQTQNAWKNLKNWVKRKECRRFMINEWPFVKLRQQFYIFKGSDGSRKPEFHSNIEARARTRVRAAIFYSPFPETILELHSRKCY